MSILAKLTVVDVERTANSSDPKKVFIANCRNQIDIVRKEAKGEELPPRTRRSYFKNGLNYFVSASYGSEKLDLGGGNSTVQAGNSLEDVVKVFEMLIEAAEANELDKQLQAAFDKKKADLAKGEKRGRKANKAK